jgi:hypothetical protein
MTRVSFNLDTSGVVEVFGDVARQDGIPHPWERGIRCPVTLDLAAGIYRYKYKVDGEWRIDPHALIDNAEGVQNNFVVVGGITEPIIFAPDRRHCFSSGGKVHVVAEASADQWRRQLPLDEVGRRSDRVLLKGELDFTPGGGQAPALRVAPTWLRKASIYGIFVDRWLSSGRDKRAIARHHPSNPGAIYGGDLDAIRNSLSYFEDLGVTAIALTPVHKSDTPHRYDGIDLLEVDPRLGSLPELVDAAHKRGIKIIVDASVTHVNEKHFAFQDLLRNQERSQYASWFRVKKFPIVKRDATTFEHYYRCPELPWFNLRGPAADYAIEAIAKLVATGVDGVRLDAMDDAPDAFWSRVRETFPGVLFLGEVIDDQLHLRLERHVDVATDFRTRDALLAFFAEKKIDAPELISRLVFAQHRTGAYFPETRCAFIDNHDTARFLSRAGGNVIALRNALALLLFMPETAWITAGTEAHLHAGTPETLLDDAWGDRLPMPPLEQVDPTTTTLMRRLLKARRGLEGPLVVKQAEGVRLVVEREGGRLSLDTGEPILEV